jgi:hypothetical protein
MEMNILAMAIALYFLGGIVVLWIFDLVTKRIRNKMEIATAETQQRMGEAGSPMSGRSARMFFMGLMWLFWPAVIIGAIAEAAEGLRKAK